MQSKTKGRPKGTGKYYHVINARLDDYTYNWILLLCKQMCIDKTEVIRRVLEDRAKNDISYILPEKKGVV